jgi:NAD-dependent dihydropyrimidine dehydrogenase PreA subunit
MLPLLDRESVTPQAESVGLVFPIYLMTLPIPVNQFVQKLDLSAVEYLFAVAVYGGTATTARSHLDEMLEPQGRSLDAYYLVKTIYNTPTGLMPISLPFGWPIKEKKIAEMLARVAEDMETIPTAIANREPHGEPPLKAAWHRALAKMLRTDKGLDTSVPYYADDTCTSCGTCEQVCPSGRVKLTEGTPEWQPDVTCYACFACFNYCPTQSILIGKRFTAKTGRYHYPGVAAEDVAGQKQGTDASL